MPSTRMMREPAPSARRPADWRDARRRGAILPMAAAAVVMILAFVCLTVDVGYIALTRGQLQSAADSSAMAAAVALEYRSLPGVRQAAQDVAAAHRAAGRAVALAPAADVEIGRWDAKKRAFVPLVAAQIDKADAVRVTTQSAASRGTQLKLFFGPVLGTREAEVRTRAVARVESNLCGRLVGLRSVRVQNTSTDSYHSGAGPYESQTPGRKGHVCSDGPVTIHNGTVRGHATSGQGYDVTLSSGGQATEGTSRRTSPIDAPAVDTSLVRTSNDNSRIGYRGGDLKLTGGNLVVPAGTYYISGDVSISGSAKITFTGPTVFYITGTVSATGNGMVNNNRAPSDLQVYLTGPTAKFAGNSDFYGVIYAPNTDVTITGSAHYYGAVLGKTLLIDGNAGIHYDEAIDPFTPKFARACLCQ